MAKPKKKEQEKVSVTMVGDMASALQIASYQRRSCGEEDCDVTGLVEEAVSDWLHKEIYGPTPVPDDLRLIDEDSEAAEPAPVPSTELAPVQPNEPTVPTDRRREAMLITMGLVLLGTIGAGVAWLTQRGASDLAEDPAVTQTSDSGTAATTLVPTGVLLVDAQPWAEVERVWDQSGKEVALPVDRYTPLRLELPPGRYSATLSRAGSTVTQTCAAHLAEAAAVTCMPEQIEMDATGLLKETGWWR